MSSPSQPATRDKSSTRRFRFALLALWIAAGVTACVDNATKLRFDTAKHLSRLEVDRTETAVSYQPVDHPDLAYWLILFPDHQTSEDDLLEAGVESRIARRVFRELNYLDIGWRQKIVVVQKEGRLSFTGPEGFSVPDLLVAERRGVSRVRLERSPSGWQAVAIE